MTPKNVDTSPFISYSRDSAEMGCNMNRRTFLAAVAALAAAPVTLSLSNVVGKLPSDLEWTGLVAFDFAHQHAIAVTTPDGRRQAVRILKRLEDITENDIATAHEQLVKWYMET
jgi:hypothetical protein